MRKPPSRHHDWHDLHPLPPPPSLLVPRGRGSARLQARRRLARRLRRRRLAPAARLAPSPSPPAGRAPPLGRGRPMSGRNRSDVLRSARAAIRVQALHAPELVDRARGSALGRLRAGRTGIVGALGRAGGPDHARVPGDGQPRRGGRAALRRAGAGPLRVPGRVLRDRDDRRRERAADRHRRPRQRPHADPDARPGRRERGRQRQQRRRRDLAARPARRVPDRADRRRARRSTRSPTGLENDGVVQPVVDDFARRSFADAAGTRIAFRFFRPASLRQGRTYPLVLFLHGGGETGSPQVRPANETQITANRGAIVWATPERQAKHPAFVVAPQLPGRTSQWTEPAIRPR